jgi:hypothetical protein
MARTSKKRARESSPGSEAPRPVRTKLSAFEERYDTATKSNEDVLVSLNLFRFYSIHFDCLTSRSLHIEAQVKNWTSPCYSHFKAPVILVENGVVKYQFICRTYVSIFHFIFAHPISRGHRNPSIVLARKREEDSTTNLVRHVKSCEGQVVDPSKSIANYAQGSTYNKAELRYLVSRWVFECHRPFAIIDDAPLQSILKMLYAKVETPSQTTLSRDVKEIHGISKVHVGRYLQVRLSYDFFFLQT